jgi:hypothetical protein
LFGGTGRAATVIVAVVVGIALLYSISAFEVDAATTLNPPGSPKVSRVSPTALKLTWEKAEGASGYLIYRYDSKTKRLGEATGGRERNGGHRGISTFRDGAHRLPASDLTRLDGIEYCRSLTHAVWM